MNSFTDDHSFSHFVLSPYTTRLRLGSSHVIITHLLGRHRIICSLDLAGILDRIGNGDGHIDARTVSMLRRANILQVKGNEECEWIRSAYARAEALAEIYPTPLLPPLGQTEQRSLNAGTFLITSASLATFALSDRCVVATHPSRPPLYMSADFWLFARSFADGRPVRSGEERKCAFLKEKGILWGAPVEEEQACINTYSLDPEFFPDLKIVECPDVLFRQIHRPYFPNHVDVPTTPAKVLLIGPCVTQQFSECLEYQGFPAGWFVKTTSFLEIDSRIADDTFDLVVLNAGQFVPYIVQFFNKRRWDDCRTLVDRAVEKIAQCIEQIRTYTSAPVALASANAPTLGTCPPGSGDAYRLAELFATLNVRLAELMRRYSKCFLLDEMDAKERLKIGTYWDDTINSSVHRAPISCWNWTYLKPGMTDRPPNPKHHQPAPPIDCKQSDPAHAMTLVVLEALSKLYHRKIDTLIFEPRGLLWPAQYRQSDLEQAANRSFLADVEDYWYSGIAEALFALSQRGVAVICLTDMSKNDLTQAVAPSSTDNMFLSMRDFHSIHFAEDKHVFISDFLSERGKSDHDILYIDFTQQDLMSKEGIYCIDETARWRLREILLRSPALAYPLFEESADGPTRTLASTTHRTSMTMLSVEEAAQAVSTAMKTILPRECGLSEQDLGDLEYFADAGIDSLSMLRILAAFEHELNICLESWERGNRSVLEISGMRTILVNALLRSHSAGQPKDHKT